MVTGNPHVLLEMSDEPDCRFVAAWLFRAAQAQSFWTQALSDREFADHVGLLHAEGDPDLAAFALEILGELEYRHHVASLVRKWSDTPGEGKIRRKECFVRTAMTPETFTRKQKKLGFTPQKAHELLGIGRSSAFKYSMRRTRARSPRVIQVSFRSRAAGCRSRSCRRPRE
jgi:hypothetical protein